MFTVKFVQNFPRNLTLASLAVTNYISRNNSLLRLGKLA